MLVFFYYYYFSEIFLNNPEISVMSIDKNVFILNRKGKKQKQKTNKTHKLRNWKQNSSEQEFSLRYFEKFDEFLSKIMMLYAKELRHTSLIYMKRSIKKKIQ